jgi:gliding motility-associated protein GldL
MFFETSQGKYLKNFIIGLGASVVLLGALFKIQHWPGAGEMLTAGMVTEALIFALLGIIPPLKDYYWERYYPDITVNPKVEAYQKGVKPEILAKPAESLTQSLDKMLAEAEITAPNLKRLGDNFQTFGKAVNQVKDMTDVIASTQVYSQSAREAAEALGAMKNTFLGAAQTMQSFNNAAEDTAKFHNQVNVLSGNLYMLNQVYEAELADANNHLRAMNRFYSNLVLASDAMATSTEDAKNTNEQLARLGKNLASLNDVYSNMLGAMKGK